MQSGQPRGVRLRASVSCPRLPGVVPTRRVPGGSYSVGCQVIIQQRLLTDPAEFVRWMADEAVLDPRPRGVVRWTHANGDTCSGAFVELVPDRRVVFSNGRERLEIGIPPGSTTVEIDLHPTDEGSTRLRPVHHGLDDPMAGAHHGGWRHYLNRLRRLAAGDTPGADPFATTRVPTPAELRTQQ